MILSMEKIDEWNQGDSIDVGGTMCRNPNDAWIVHIGTFYIDSDEPINPKEDAKELLESGWVSSEQWDEGELVEFIEENKDELK